LHTNNYVEFQGLLDLLKWAETTKISKLEIFCDSALVVNTVNGVWELKSEDLRPLWLLATALKVRGQHTLKHVDGHAGNEGNELADWFCNDILNKEGK
jgi:ribonuclease HI